jgi:hypothetical protein
MKKRFNTTGLCVPTMHYMVDISQRVAQTVQLVEQGDYFTINRPRQYGKTTMLTALAQALRDEYVIIDTSFEGTGDGLFGSEESFCSKIFGKLARDSHIYDPKLADSLDKLQDGVADFDGLSSAITELVDNEDRAVVLLIDEVDQSSNSPVFLKFLGLLRNKYLARNKGQDKTFQSVVLAGVHDIKNLELKIRDAKDARYNSPWNIAVEYKVDMEFCAADIATMLSEYQAENRDVLMDIDTVSQRIYEWTSGYPCLVSSVCLCIETKFNRDWSKAGVDAAVKELLKGKSTLFDDVIKNVQNHPDIKAVVWAMLFEGTEPSYNFYAYLEAQGLDSGYLLTFSLGKMPQPAAAATPAWREVCGKQVFEVVV